MTINSNQSYIFKPTHFIIKLFVTVLLMGLAFRLFFYRSPEFESKLPVVVEAPFIDKPVESKHIVSDFNPIEEEEEEVELQPASVPEDQINLLEEKCDLFTGDWIPNPSGPIYTNESCPLIESHQNCMKNGRPDSEYLYWRWNPRACDLPKFDPRRFLESTRNKNWALIGDSISRNHVQSLLCMLSTVEKPVEVYHDEEYKSKRWHFRSYNFSMSVIWSPYLVEATIFEDFNGLSSSEVELQLDKLDKKWTDLYQNLDYMIISTGKWFLKSTIYYENQTIVGCHYCPKRNLTELGFDYAYRKTLKLVLNFIAKSNHKGMVFFRTSTPDHFENGEWHNGGNCSKTAPAIEGQVELKILNKILLDIERMEFEKAVLEASRNGVNLKLLDFTNLLLSRPDGHPGPYREFHPFEKGNNGKVQNDCLHWCLPGPMDSMNDVIMEMMVNS